MVETLGNRLENDTLQTFTLAEQLNTNLTNLNNLIEGNDCSHCCIISVFCISHIYAVDVLNPQSIKGIC